MKKIILLLFVCISGAASAQIITIPDVNFKNALVNNLCVDTDGDSYSDADVDTNNDGEIDQNEALIVTDLDVYGYLIDSLDGITYFSNLTSLDCGGNRLITLDLSGLTNLSILHCNSSQIMTLNVSGLSNLNLLTCRNNPLTDLDILSLSNLLILDCNFCQLTSLNVSGLSNLANLDCSGNRITSLNISSLISLIILDCSYNRLTTLNVSTLANLDKLYCNDNQLVSLYLKNWTTEDVYFPNNPNLTYICADDSQIPNIQSLANSYGMTNCVINSDCNVGVEPVLSTEAINLNLFPNPAESILYIPADVQITQADIFDMKGALVRSVNVRNNQIEVQGLSSGTYFTRLYSEAKLYSAKFMVK